MNDKNLNAIILAATEFAGMGDSYFKNKTRHLLPVADRPLISHLIEKLDKINKINKKFIVIDEAILGYKKVQSCKETYEDLFGPRIGDDIELFGQNTLTKIGTFEAVKECVSYYTNTKKVDLFPLIVVYGDNWISERFLNTIIDKFNKNQDSSNLKWKSGSILRAPVLYWGMVEYSGNGGIILNRLDKNKSYSEIKSDNIFEIHEHRIEFQSNENSLLDTGILIITKDSWEEILELVRILHRPSSQGIFSFTNILRQALILKNIDLTKYNEKRNLQQKGTFGGAKNRINLDIIGIVGKSIKPGELRIDCCENINNLVENLDWYGIDYPWELLEANQIQIIDSAEKSASATNIEKDLGKKLIVLKKNEKIRLSNGSTLQGPLMIEKDVNIGSDCLISTSFIGRNASIEDHSIVKGSTICENVRLRFSTVVESSVVMNKSILNCHSVIDSSIVGENVMIGIGVKAPCQRLRRPGKDSRVIYFSDLRIMKTASFGAIIGDDCQIGSGTIIHPGRRIGRSCSIHANCQILRNLGAFENFKDESFLKQNKDDRDDPQS